jgi:DNA-binding GntR family transcriptional regulator
MTAVAYPKSRSNVAVAFATLRDDIISLRIRPGSLLSRLELQMRFRISSTPIRDLLSALRDEGLVDVFPQHATVVTYIDVGHAKRAQFLRRSIELEIVHTLAQSRDDALIAKLRSLIRQQTAFGKLDEHEAFTTVDQAFHQTMYEAAGVADFWQLVRRQSGHLDRLRRLHLPVRGKMDEILNDHVAIVDAIERGSAQAAQKALRAHLSHSLDYADRLRKNAPEYFGPAIKTESA